MPIYNQFLKHPTENTVVEETVNLLTYLIINTEFKFLTEYLLTLILPGFQVKGFGSYVNSLKL